MVLRQMALAPDAELHLLTCAESRESVTMKESVVFAAADA
jgi:hypothetical protein